MPKRKSSHHEDPPRGCTGFGSFTSDEKKEETDSKIEYGDIRKRAEALDNSNEMHKFIALFYAMEVWRCDTA